ncbi:MAG: MFS transporter [Thalassobaculum sp.]|uniref:MFS transporter n=2 Tax=Thalassobaculum sp. TaxID=2022740 RepID=UPI0032EDCF15
MEIRFPMWLRVVDRPGANVFAILSATEAFSRSLIAGIIPLEAYELLGSARNVSITYTTIGVMALLASFAVPLVIRVVRRKWVFSAGCLFMVAASLLMITEATIPFIASLQFRALAVVCVNIALNLYILDYIRRKDFVTAEPRRLAVMGVAWFIGPALGIWLYKTHGLLAVCVPSAVFALLALGYFWLLRMQDNPAVAPATRKPPMPWHNIRRFIAQPRLRLAWAIPFARSAFWTTFFVYPPLYIVQAGGDEMLAAAMLSGGQGMLFLAPIAGRLGSRFGIRGMVMGALVFSGALSVIAGLLQPGPAVLAALFFVACLGSVTLDALGNIPFLRSVHPYERSEMTSVFRTYIEMSQLLPAAIFAGLLIIFPLGSVFVALGVLMIGTAGIAIYLPRRL